MTVTSASFYQAFPEFADVEKYPVATVDMWVAAARSLLSAERWGDLLDLGTGLFVAHNLALSRLATAAAASGAAPGGATGIVASKAVDKVSVSYDTSSASLEGAGAWNLTTYGVRYRQLALMIGTGGLQL
ncbi:DUF4054 domain-containing protein [Roseixanthobacter pseudopolyaromaticivorans]|uniref:DUF4054 domain-containing protein n=1 Tax=Xanthobacteraceae TaxID=335928 RepID=UPI003726E3BC